MHRFPRRARALLLTLCLLAAPSSACASAKTTPLPAPQSDSAVASTPHPFFPPLTPEGFMSKGEYVRSDAEKGFWLYATPTLRVEILRKTDPAIPMTWYEADVWCTPDEPLYMAANSDSWTTLSYGAPEDIAKRVHAPFAISADYYPYRINRDLPVGIVIRGGHVVSSTTLRDGTSRFPNLDTMAILPDGSLKVYRNNELTAKEYLDMGARDVLCFGPLLVRDGQASPTLGDRKSTPQPRLALGMVEPGHYVSILVEGRIENSEGTYLPVLADMMLQKGCTEALNLDGGQTAVMLFMGEAVNRIGSYAGGKTSPRDASELLIIGRTGRQR
ncbi:MAG: phosphodiester glycosidase family protein [Oscillospiraceae bacterium]|jgi:hypothetical protein|nr:phosphodiester glycosidase family protein [Oscillospiraceae bacterium]